jgi:nitrous oxidase accessory protein
MAVRVFILFIFLLLWYGVNSAMGAIITVGKNGTFTSIQPALLAARPYDTVQVNGGIYREGNIQVNGPVTLIGIGRPTIDGQYRDEQFTITSSDVNLQGFEIINSGILHMKDIAGIKVLASARVKIHDNILRNCNFGIYLSNTALCTVSDNRISGKPGEELNSGNGIHCLKGDSLQIIRNEITGQRDGIYFEFITNSAISNNISYDNMRYGLHFMFSHSNRYTANRFSANGAGVAVMYSRNVDMHENSFDRNWGPSSYGILLKDISDSRITHNRFENNSAGIYMEGSNRIQLEDNLFSGNGWALRVQASCSDNRICGNNFTGNTFDVSTNGQTQLNRFESNYWDKYEGYDLDHNGKGDVPYWPVSLFSMIVEQMPAGLLMIRSLMVYLLDRAEKILPALTPALLVDDSPAMRYIPIRQLPAAPDELKVKLRSRSSTHDAAM